MPNKNPWHVLSVGVDCAGGKPGDPLHGTELSPGALTPGIVEALRAYNEGDLNVRIEGTERDEQTGIIGFDSVCKMTFAVRRRVSEIYGWGGRPFVVGGCCSLVPGAVAGASDYYNQPVGLAYVDGHADLYTGKTSPTGEFADMPISVLLGLDAPEALFGWNPPLLPQHLVFLGHRDSVIARADGSLLPEAVGAGANYSAEVILRKGGSHVGGLASMTLSECPGGFWLALDFDVLCRTIFPATDYLMEGGLNWSQLYQLLEVFAREDNLRGVSLACYNPKKDPDGAGAKEIVKFVKALFS